MSEKERPRELVKLTVNVEKEIMEQVSLMALKHNVSRSDEINASLADRVRIEQLIARGYEIISRAPDGTQEVLVFPRIRTNQHWKHSEE